MSQVFISYSRTDKSYVARLVEALKAEGIDVWWDPAIVPGTEFSKVIEEALSRSKCVLVVWSPQSVQSGWVRDEANEALKTRKLIPITMESAQPPLGFRQIQAVDLTDWDADRKDRRYSALVVGIRSLLEHGELPPGAWPPPPVRLSVWRRYRTGIIAIGFSGAMIAVAASWQWVWPVRRSFSIYDGYQIYDPGTVRSNVTKDDCIAVCKVDLECKAFTYFAKNRACFLLTSYVDVRRNDEFTSGVLSALPQPLKNEK